MSSEAKSNTTAGARQAFDRPPTISTSSITAQQRLDRQNHAASQSASLTSFWPGPSQIRRLFRFFDSDGDGSISASELRQGLLAMGFDTSHIANLHKFHSELSQDNTGVIRESQFIQAFRALNRSTLAQQLNSQGKAQFGSGSYSSSSAGPCSLTIIDFGEVNNAELGTVEGKFELRKINASELSQELSSEPQNYTSRVRWIDILGLNGTTNSLLMNHFNLSVESLQDIELEQTANCEFYPKANIMKLVVHILHLNNEPIELDKHGKTQLVKPKFYKKHKPALDSVAVTLLVIEDHTVITLRPYSEIADLNNFWEDIQSLLKQACNNNSNNINRSKSSLNLNSGSTATNNNNISSKIRTNANFIGLATAQSLCMELLNEIIDKNWLLRDIFKDWKKTLTEAIRNEVDQAQLTHIIDLESCAANVSKLLLPAVKMFTDLCISQHIQQANQSFYNKSAQQSPLNSAAKQATQKPLFSRISSNNNRGQQAGGAGSSVLSPFQLSQAQSQRSLYLSGVYSELRNIQKSVNRLFEQAKFVESVSSSLKQFYKQRRDEQSNRTLYLLTVVTTVVTPMQLATGIYGMNFDNMPELHYQYGYQVWWAINIAIIILISIWFKKQRWI
jgi:Mg2+ and Co2+ transporter CorA